MLTPIFNTIDAQRRNFSAKNAYSPNFVVHAFMVWRIMSLLTLRYNRDGSKRTEAGPYDILTKFRKTIGVNPDGAQKNELAKVFTCIYCSSFWIGLVVALLLGKGLGYGLALSTAAVMIERYQFGA